MMSCRGRRGRSESNPSRSTETVTLTRSQLEAILQLVSQFGGMNVSPPAGQNDEDRRRKDEDGKRKDEDRRREDEDKRRKNGEDGEDRRKISIQHPSASHPSVSNPLAVHSLPHHHHSLPPSIAYIEPMREGGRNNSPKRHHRMMNRVTTSTILDPTERSLDTERTFDTNRTFDTTRTGMEKKPKSVGEENSWEASFSSFRLNDPDHNSSGHFTGQQQQPSRSDPMRIDQTRTCDSDGSIHPLAYSSYLASDKNNHPYQDFQSNQYQDYSNDGHVTSSGHLASGQSSGYLASGQSSGYLANGQSSVNLSAGQQNVEERRGGGVRIIPGTTNSNPFISRRRAFPIHSSNLELSSHSNIFPSPSTLSPSMSMSASFSGTPNFHSLNDGISNFSSQKVDAPNENVQLGNSPSFRRCNRITGGTEVTDYDLKKQKMQEYQAMLDEQRKEKERRIQAEKEKLAAEEAAMEARFLKQQERMRKEFEEEQARMEQKKINAERKRMAVVEAIQNTPVIGRKKWAHGGNDAEGRYREGEGRYKEQNRIQTADTISLASVSTFTLGTLESTPQSSDSQGALPNSQGTVREHQVQMKEQGTPRRSASFGNSVSQLVSGGGHPEVGMYQELTGSKNSSKNDQKLKPRMVQKLSSSSTLSSASSSSPSSSSSSLVTQVMQVNSTTLRNTRGNVLAMNEVRVTGGRKEEGEIRREGGRKEEGEIRRDGGEIRREEGKMRRNGNGGGRIETSGRMNNSIDGGRKCTKAMGESTQTHEREREGKRGNVEKREVSVQTEIRLLYSWLDQLKNEGKIMKSPNPYHHDLNLHPHLTQQHLLNPSQNQFSIPNPSSSKSSAAGSGRGKARSLERRKGSLSPSSPSSNKSHLLGSGSKRSSSSPRFLSSLSSSKSPSPTSFPSPPNFPSSSPSKGHQNVRGQTKWTRDANQATWKPVGDVVGRSDVVTKGFTNKSRTSHESHLTQPLIRPSYGRKFVVTKP